MLESGTNHLSFSAFSTLDGNVAYQALQRPPTFLFVAAGAVVGFQILFLITFLVTAFASGRLTEKLEIPFVQNMITCIGLVGALAGRFPSSVRL